MGRLRSLNWAELAAVVAILGVLGLIGLPWLRRQADVQPQASCQMNLKQWGMICRMYAEESPESFFPPMSNYSISTSATLRSPDMRAVYPEYLTDPGIAVCPSVKDATEDTPMLERLAEIRRLVESGEATHECELMHLSLWKTYVYFNYYTRTPAEGQIAYQAWRNAGSQALGLAWENRSIYQSQLRLLYDDSGRQYGEKIALGDACPYKGEAYYLYGRFAAGAFGSFFDGPKAAPGGRDVPFMTESGDVLTAWRADTDPERGQPVPEIIPRIRLSLSVPGRLADDDAAREIAREQSIVPVMWDTFVPEMVGKEQSNHVPLGSNVLFMDGHVAFVRWRKPYGETYPLKATPPDTVGGGKEWLRGIMRGY